MPTADEVARYERPARINGVWTGIPVSKEDGDAILKCLREMRGFKETIRIDASNRHVANRFPAEHHLHAIRTDGGTNTFWFEIPDIVLHRVRGETRRAVPMEECTTLA